ncbi:12162_t:CDS:2 [Funneliformis caledonium]|uniref:12162_t:CDS:1 n=1 Tax=Funneliformis caledonium TaxID=1117310 RepID=A0A9N9E6P0_9GLOM|nr:12162_t:CDS:2 [Funneliformis caledonium]
MLDIDKSITWSDLNLILINGFELEIFDQCIKHIGDHVQNKLNKYSIVMEYANESDLRIRMYFSKRNKIFEQKDYNICIKKIIHKGKAKLTDFGYSISLGVLLWELSSGKAPHENQYDHLINYKILLGDRDKRQILLMNEYELYNKFWDKEHDNDKYFSLSLPDTIDSSTILPSNTSLIMNPPELEKSINADEE